MQEVFNIAGSAVSARATANDCTAGKTGFAVPLEAERARAAHISGKNPA